MTTEQLTMEFMKLAEHQAVCDAERKRMTEIIEELKEDIKTTKKMTEDVHILALNMEGMQKTIQETRDKVEELSQKDYNNYVESKKVVRNNIISGVVGSILTVIGGAITILVSILMKGG